MKKILLATALVLALSGCSDPKEEVIPPDLNEAQMKELAEKVKDLPTEEKELLTGYIARSEISKAFGESGAATGTTVGEAIENQRKWVAEKKLEKKAKAERAAKLKMEKEAKLQEVMNTVLVTVFDKSVQKLSFIDYLVIDIEILNKSNKTIIGIKGGIEFYDKFGDEIIKLDFAEDQMRLLPNNSLKIDPAWNYNEFIGGYVKLANTPLEDMTYKFKPDAILFDDGSRLEMPESDGNTLFN